jgi:tetratricopeptide (TPR) repeat protein
MYKLPWIFFISIFLHHPLYAQTVWDIFSDRFLLAQQRYEKQDYSGAIFLFEKDFQKRPSDITALLIARSYYKIGEPESSIVWYEKVVDQQKIEPNDWLQKAICCSKVGDYDKAIAIYKRLDNQLPGRFADVLYSVENLPDLYKDSIFYLVKPTNLNTSFSEISPAFYDQGIVFSSSRKRHANSGKVELFDLYYAKKLDVGMNQAGEGHLFETPTIFGRTFNSHENESNPTFFDFGNKMIFTKNSGKAVDDNGKLRLFTAELFNGDWGNVHMIDIDVQGASVAHPSISKDGNRLYFASDMPGGYGGVDLYVSHRTDKGWGKPQNLGAKINSPGDDMFPYLHEDQTFYFASNGHGGLGGLDIFATYVEEDSTLQLVNLGYPINTAADDFGITLNETGDYGYFCSNRGAGKAKDNIYYVELYKDKFKYEISGTVLLDKTHFKKNEEINPLENLTVQVVHSQNGEILQSQNTDEKGHFSFSLSWNANYRLEAHRETGARYQTNLHLPVNHPLDKNIIIVFIPSMREILEQ